MVDLAEIGLILQTISVMSAATAAVIGVRSYINTNKRAEEAKKKEQETRIRELETRQAQIFMDIYSTFCEESTQSARNEISKWSYKDYDDFQRKYGFEVNPEAAKIHSSLSFFFEGLGVLVLHKLIDPRLVDDLMSGPVISYWEKLRAYYMEYRIRFDWPQMAEYTEYLYNQIKPIAERQRIEMRDWSK